MTTSRAAAISTFLLLFGGCWDGIPLEEMTFVEVPKGTFNMGSSAGEPCRDKAMENQRQVTLSHNFSLGAAEVTQDQFEVLMGYNPSHYLDCGLNCPAEFLSWHEAAAFCSRLSEREGVPTCYTCTGVGTRDVRCTPGKATDCTGYRLPTEAEWEWAYRAGTTTAFYSGAIDPGGCQSNTTPYKDKTLDAIAWYLANSQNTTHPVKGKAPNSLGLYDMAGNVAEWVEDCFKVDLGTGAVTDPVQVSAACKQRVLRGGAWDHPPSSHRAAARDADAHDKRHRSYGFRCMKYRW